ncbi:GTPase IMAP family member 2-like [Cyprinodon tularosa]|uniref:GTPase IMAP family member 2-like n=1 Tax=Cyprinodon tularosa TaxID=77115 RepID=UPI0018E1E9F2|nr:GTPase IMAP family member 2-like [Cyprinodon tularosa]
MATSSDARGPGLFRIGSVHLPEMSEMRLILLGDSWYDKSSVTNLLLGSNMLNREREPNFPIKVCGRIMTTKTVLINTPDLLCPSISEPKLKEHVRRCLSLCFPGPHVFLLVVQLNLDEQQKQRLYRILELFNKDSFKHSLVLISTPGWETSASHYPFHPRHIRDLIKMCEEKWIRLQSNPKELLQKLSQILTMNSLSYVTCGHPSQEPNEDAPLPLDSSVSLGMYEH